MGSGADGIEALGQVEDLRRVDAERGREAGAVATVVTGGQLNGTSVRPVRTSTPAVPASPAFSLTPAFSVTPALSKVAISDSTRAADSTNGNARHAPVPSPSRRSRSTSGSMPNASSTADAPGSVER